MFEKFLLLAPGLLFSCSLLLFYFWPCSLLLLVSEGLLLSLLLVTLRLGARCRDIASYLVFSRTSSQQDRVRYALEIELVIRCPGCVSFHGGSRVEAAFPVHVKHDISYSHGHQASKTGLDMLLK